MLAPLNNPECALYLSYLLWAVLLLLGYSILASSQGRASWGIAIVLALIAFAVSPWQASDLNIVPDSVEYAAGAINSVSRNSYFITVENISHPPRYAPWFSLLLMPTYNLLGPDPGYGIFVVLIFALLGALAAWSIGFELSGTFGATLSLLGLFVASEYPLFSKQIMIDVPATALLLLAALGFLNMRRHSMYKLALPVGIAIGLAGALRPILLLALIPIALHLFRARLWFRLLISTLPSLAFLSATLLYNKAVFGDIFRSGYNYWSPIPYDFSQLVWSADYLGSNLSVIFSYTSIPALLVLLFLTFYWVRRNRTARLDHSLLFFVLPTTFFITAAHLLYFFGSSRFYLGTTTLLAVALGGYAGHYFSWLAERLPRLKGYLIIFTVLLAVSLQFSLRREPLRREAIERIRLNTEADSTIISAIDPAYFSLLLPDRQIIPISRRVEYASKLVAASSIAGKIETPDSWREHRAAAALKSGAREAVAYTAIPDVLRIAQLLSSNHQVFLDSSLATENENKFLSSHFVLEPIVPGLSRLTLLPEPSL